MAIPASGVPRYRVPCASRLRVGNPVGPSEHSPDRAGFRSYSSHHGPGHLPRQRGPHQSGSHRWDAGRWTVFCATRRAVRGDAVRRGCCRGGGVEGGDPGRSRFAAGDDGVAREVDPGAGGGRGVPDHLCAGVYCVRGVRREPGGREGFRPAGHRTLDHSMSPVGDQLHWSQYEYSQILWTSSYDEQLAKSLGVLGRSNTWRCSGRSHLRISICRQCTGQGRTGSSQDARSATLLRQGQNHQPMNSALCWSKAIPVIFLRLWNSFT